MSPVKVSSCARRRCTLVRVLTGGLHALHVFEVRVTRAIAQRKGSAGNGGLRLVQHIGADHVLHAARHQRALVQRRERMLTWRGEAGAAWEPAQSSHPVTLESRTSRAHRVGSSML